MENTVKYRKFILPIVVGLLIWALTPFKPDAVDQQHGICSQYSSRQSLLVLHNRCQLGPSL